MSITALCLEAEELLGRLREDSPSQEEQARLLVVLDALRFLSESGQHYDFEDYRKGLDENAPPLVVAAFTTLSEAESWLKENPKPPHSAYILVSGEYYRLTYLRERNLRKLQPSPDTLGYYLEDMTRDGLPAPVATFDTREEAEAWLHAQPEPPRQVFILIGGEHHLAAYHHRVNLRALYSLSQTTRSERAREPQS